MTYDKYFDKIVFKGQRLLVVGTILDLAGNKL